jgi:hypothetical protein
MKVMKDAVYGCVEARFNNYEGTIDFRMKRYWHGVL